MLNDVLIVYNNSSSYFFSACSDNAFKVLKNGRAWYLLYRIFRKLRSPLVKLCYGKWLDVVTSVSTIVIFDSAYDWCITEIVKSVSPSVSIILFFWNKIDKPRLDILHHFEGSGEVISCSKEDSKQYGLLWLNTFYSFDFAKRFICADNKEAVFLGRNKERLSTLMRIEVLLRQVGIPTNFIVVDELENNEISTSGIRVVSKLMDYGQYCNLASSAGVLVDVPFEGSDLISLRVMESLFFNKKLITTDSNVLNFDFSRYGNIYYLDLDKEAQRLRNEIREFINKQTIPYPLDLLEAYDFESRLKSFSSLARPVVNMED